MLAETMARMGELEKNRGETGEAFVKLQVRLHAARFPRFHFHLDRTKIDGLMIIVVFVELPKKLHTNR